MGSRQRSLGLQWLLCMVHIRLNYRYPRRVRKSLCPEEGHVHVYMASYSALQIEPIFLIVLIPESA
jgi:hypothetical protein